MKKTLIKFLLCGLPLLCTSCFTKVDFGFPTIVTFTSAGGEQVISGDQSFTYAEIHDYKDGIDTDLVQLSENGETYKWLTVEGIEIWCNDTLKCRYYYDLKLSADPNTTGDSRTLYVRLYACDEYAEIKVVQQK